LANIYKADSGGIKSPQSADERTYVWIHLRNADKGEIIIIDMPESNKSLKREEFTK